MLAFDPIRILALLIALTLHEWAHAYTATRLGDPTPGNEGRLTLNPLAHLDPIGTLMILFGPFGWAKPVPINPGNFRDHRRGILLTAFAGPASNFVLAVFSFIALILLARIPDALSFWELLQTDVQGPALFIFAVRFLQTSLAVNLGLMAFNLLPIAPLDGSNVLASLLPFRLAERYEEWMRYGMYVLLFLILFDPMLPFSPISTWVGWIGGGLFRLMLLLASTIA